MTIIFILILLFALKFNYQVTYIDYLIGFVLLALFVSFALCLYVKKALLLNIEADDRWYKEGDSIKLKMLIDAPSFHPDIVPQVTLENLQTGEIKTLSGICEDQGTVYEFKDLSPGTLRLSAERVMISGFFGLIKLSKKTDFEKVFNVYPKKAPVNYRYVRKSYIPGEGEILNAKGDDYTEIFEVRPLQEGDNLKHVHKALSAKYDEYIVKVGSDSRKSFYTYYLNDGESFSVMLNLLGQLAQLRETVIKDEGAFIMAVYKGKQRELVFDSQLYSLVDEVYKDYVIPREKKAK